MMFADNCCHYEEQLNPHRYVFVGNCIQCKDAHSVVIPAPELYKYRQGNLIQTALKSVTADDREFLMSGICPSCWTKIFSEKED